MVVGDLCVNAVVAVGRGDTVVEAARRMRTRSVGDVIVTDEKRRPVGMLTDRDIVVSAVAQSADKLDRLLVGDVMTRGVVTVRRRDSLGDAIKKMRAAGIRRLPVVNARGSVEGMLALDDILHGMADQFGALVGLLPRAQAKERTLRK